MNHHNKSHKSNYSFAKVEEFMFTQKRIDSLLSEYSKKNEFDDFIHTIKKREMPIKRVVVEEPVKKVVEEPKKIKNNFFLPKDKDTLFWCYYILKNGFSKYEYPGVRSFENEKKTKFECIELLRSKKQILKEKKVKSLKEDVEDELANKEKIRMKTFIALCLVDNISILFIHKKKCFVLDCGSDTYNVIHQYDNPEKYVIETDTNKDIWEKYKTTYFHWESLEKPLRAVSSYKVDELLQMCKKMGIEIVDKKNKNELYELLLMNL